MAHLEFTPAVSVTPIEDDAEFRSFLSDGSADIHFVPESQGPSASPGLKFDYGDFIKWARQEYPEFRVSAAQNVQKIMLRSADVWLPLVYLAGDTSVQIFLNMAASYLYDRAKGALRNETPRIHMSIVYEDRLAHKSRRFDFSGDAKALSKAIKRFDLNNFFDEAP